MINTDYLKSEAHKFEVEAAQKVDKTPHVETCRVCLDGVFKYEPAKMVCQNMGAPGEILPVVDFCPVCGYKVTIGLFATNPGREDENFWVACMWDLKAVEAHKKLWKQQQWEQKHNLEP
jgi:hypothetical protein